MAGMRLLVMAAACLLFGTMIPAFGQGADERYIQIYSKLREADAFSEQGEYQQAITRYTEAQSALKNLQTAFPGWNDRVVNFRLEYFASKIQMLAAKLTPTNAPAEIAEIASTNRVEQAIVPASQLKAFQEEIKRLADQNSLLQAKVKEALSVQPAAVDP